MATTEEINGRVPRGLGITPGPEWPGFQEAALSTHARIKEENPDHLLNGDEGSEQSPLNAQTRLEVTDEVNDLVEEPDTHHEEMDGRV